MENLPSYVSIVLMLTTILTVIIFFKASRKSYVSLLIIIAWLGLQSFIALNDFYLVTNTLPPRFMLTLVPPILLIIVLFSTNKGRKFIDNLDMRSLTLLHIIRIPVELVLLWLSIHELIPVLMTFEGRNLDIFSGITAPLIWYLGFIKKRLSPSFLLIWNLICLALLINIVVIAILAAPFPFQKFAFDQPNIAILYFPFIWLPCLIVPLVLFSHLVMIRKLMFERRKQLILSH